MAYLIGYAGIYWTDGVVPQENGSASLSVLISPDQAALCTVMKCKHELPFFLQITVFGCFSHGFDLLESSVIADIVVGGGEWFPDWRDQRCTMRHTACRASVWEAADSDGSGSEGDEGIGERKEPSLREDGGTLSGRRTRGTNRIKGGLRGQKWKRRVDRIYACDAANNSGVLGQRTRLASSFLLTLR
ncbi:hypothetical protein HPP92_028760 [Vanilla planifolia]|uniref:Uncharacterized protein n=1 Tax=Vanilla planifolia TaxID=51239 RepID=A0A835U3N2_VANPL|nr:hypothetical protein HPP92_028760 [Vanilla planifolia]KAG0446605.1 hypothetical protein HPP92_028746 [Vanilla planifolia]